MSSRLERRAVANTHKSPSGASAPAGGVAGSPLQRAPTDKVRPGSKPLVPMLGAKQETANAPPAETETRAVAWRHPKSGTRRSEFGNPHRHNRRQAQRRGGQGREGATALLRAASTARPLPERTPLPLYGNQRSGAADPALGACARDTLLGPRGGREGAQLPAPRASVHGSPRERDSLASIAHCSSERADARRGD